MSEHAEKVRKERSEKVKRYLRKDPQGKIDASEYTPPDELMADVKTGMRPISKRQFKKGGKVVGDKGKHHAGRKKRAEGGPLDMDNRDLKAENKKRAGEKHVGGFKDGGRPKRAAGGPMMAGAAPMGPQAPINVPTQAIGGFAPSSKGLMTQAGMSALKRGGKAKRRANGGEMSAEELYGPKKDWKKVGDAVFGRKAAERTSEPKYNADAVDKAIASSNRSGRKIGAGEGKAIHSLLKGRAARAYGGGNHRPTYGSPDAATNGDAGAGKGATYDFFSGWHNLGAATPDQIANMNPSDRVAAMAAQGTLPTPPRRPARQAAPAASAPTPPPRPVASQDQMQTGRGLPASYGQTGRGLPAGGGPTFSQPSQTFSGSDMASVGKSDLPPPTPSNSIGPQIGASGTSDVPPPDPNDLLGGKAAGWYNRGGKVPGNDRITGTRPTGGRLAKADGGATKSKKGAVNIIIAVGGGQKGGMPPGGPGMPPGPPLAHPPVPPQAIGGAGAGLVPPQAGGAPPMGPGAGGPPMPPPGGAMPIGRKAGGSVTHAAGGGEGRLEKARKYGRGI